jgi:hypothetical protein
VIEALESGMSIDGPSGEVTHRPQLRTIAPSMGDVAVIRTRNLIFLKLGHNSHRRTLRSGCNLKKSQTTTKQYVIKF